MPHRQQQVRDPSGGGSALVKLPELDAAAVAEILEGLEVSPPKSTERESRRQLLTRSIVYETLLDSISDVEDTF